LQQSLYDRCPHNVIRLILNKEMPQDAENNNRYTRAAQSLRDWQQEGILQQDSARSLYVCHQDFEVEGKRFTRKGFMARVRLEPFGSGRIYPHEETMSGPKADRLKLFRATAMNLSPIFGLFPDEAGEVAAKLDAAVGRSLPIQAVDHLGAISKLWPVTNQQTISAISGLLGAKPIFIADGHHRYETALKYLEEKRAAGEATDPDHPANFVLMMLVSMHDPGLVILPTHRLISAIEGLRADQLKSLLDRYFQLDVVGIGPNAAATTWELIQSDGTQELLGFGTIADGVWQTARFRSPEQMAEAASEHSESWRGLAVAVLQRIVLEKLLSQGGVQPKCEYVHLLGEVNEAVAAKKCQVAALVPPATMDHVAQIAGNFEKMPAKSTYFYPKLLSGLVFHSLKRN